MAGEPRFDVVIVGAGPAGSTTAIALKRRLPELRVVLVDKDRFPRDKSCGDGLGPGVVRVLRSLDAMEVVAGAPKPVAVAVGGPEPEFEGFAVGPTVNGKDLSGFVLPRFIFDERLVRVAQSLGVELWEDTKFVSSRTTSSGRAVTLSRGGDEVVVESSLLVGADGANSRVRRDLGVPRQPQEFTHVALRGYADVDWGPQHAGFHPLLRIDFEREMLPAYGWVFPTGERTANVGVGVPIENLNSRSASLQELLDLYLERLAARGVKVGGLSDVIGHQLPHAASIPTLAHPSAVLIGDAGSMINSLSGEGIAYAMKAGEMLAQAVAKGARLDVSESALHSYETSFRSRYRLHFLSCWLTHRAMRSPWRAERVIRAAARDQAVMDDAALLMFDEQRGRFRTGLRIAKSGF